MGQVKIFSDSVLSRRRLLTSALAFSLPKTAIMATPEPLFAIGAIADCQFADQDDEGQRLYRRSPDKLQAAVDHFNRLQLDHVVHLGDFIDRDWRSFDRLQPIVDRLKHPWRFVLGNHEFMVPDAKKRLLPRRLGMPARYYRFATKGWVFLVIDGNDLSDYGWPQNSPEAEASRKIHREIYPAAPDWNGGIGAEQMAWIERSLVDSDRLQQNVAFYCHFPLFPENRHNLWNSGAVIAVLERHNSAKIWLNGHNHDGNYGVREGIHYVNLTAMLDTPQTSYATAQFYPDKIDLTGFGRQGSMSLTLR